MTLAAFEARLGYQLDPYQRVACERLLADQNVLVSAPTGAGKTTIADFAAFLAVGVASPLGFATDEAAPGRSRGGGRFVYTTPVKALSNQKFQELQKSFGESRVGLITGDVVINPDAQLVVMTTEVLRNMLYEGRGGIDDLAYVVLDEVHYLADRDRGAVWEEVILMLPGRVRIVALSATVSNAREFGDWLQTVHGDTAVILSSERPVPLHGHVLTSAGTVSFAQLAKTRSFRQSAFSAGERAEGLAGEDLCGRGDDVSAGERPRYGRRNGRIRGGEFSRNAVKTSRGVRGSRNARRGAGRDRGEKLLPLRPADVLLYLHDNSLLPAIFFVFSRAGTELAAQKALLSGLVLTTREEREKIREVASRAVARLSREERRVLGVAGWLNALSAGVAWHHAGLLPGMKHAVEILFQRRLVKVVFATETLALGINMPARTVVLDRLEKFNGVSKVPITPGEFTQLTGRAGRRGIDSEGNAIVVWRRGLEVSEVTHISTGKSFPLRSVFHPTPNMAVNLLSSRGFDETLATLERSFAQFQLDRSSGFRHAGIGVDVRDEARRKTAARGRVLAKKPSIAVSFERIVALLEDLGYLNATALKEYAVSGWGEVLRLVYGESDLLLTELLRRGVLHGLSSRDLVWVVSTLVSQRAPRNAVEPDVRGGIWDEVQETWLDVGECFERHGLSCPSAPQPFFAAALSAWSSGVSLAQTLTLAGCQVGDLVRAIRLCGDLLEQLARAAGRAAGVCAGENVFVELERRARKAARSLERGIIEKVEEWA